MDALNQLLSQYSLGDIILVIVLLVMCTKTLGDGIQWIYATLRRHFKKESKKEQIVGEHETINNKIDTLSENIDRLCDSMDLVSKRADELGRAVSEMDARYRSIEERIGRIEEQEISLKEHIQGYTRAFIIDKYHYYCYQTHVIDDISLQSLEVCYLYYKSNGGDSFVDGLMERIRSLPRVNLENAHIEGGK